MTTASTASTYELALSAGSLLTVSQICRALPGARDNKAANPSTVTRWILKGCPARNGERIKLKATRCGGRWLIAPSDLSLFFEALACEMPNPVKAAPKLSSAERKRKAKCEQAIKELEQRGA